MIPAEHILILVLTCVATVFILMSLYLVDTLKLANRLNAQVLKRLEEVEKELDKALTMK